MRRNIVVGLVAALGLTGCGEDTGQGTRDQSTVTTTVTQTQTTTAEQDTDGDGIPDNLDDDPYAAPSDTQGDPGDTEPQTNQKVRSLGQWGADDGIRVKVHSIRAVDSIPAANEFSNGVVDKKGSALYRVDLTVKNNLPDEIDPLCGSADGFVLLDHKDRNFDPIDNLLDINNNVCDEGIQPGFNANYVLAYRLPRGSKVGALVFWNAEDSEDFDGSVSNVAFIP